MALIELKAVEMSYGPKNSVLNQVTVTIHQGEFVYLVGPSGAGKSSLLKLLYREAEASTGRLKVGQYDLTKITDRQLPYLRRSIGVVFQDYKLLPNKTVYENVAFAMEVIGEKRKVIKKRVNEVLSQVGLKRKAKSFPAQLSGGEQQRVAIARAIVNQPKLLIADEPTGNLDPERSEEIMTILESIHEQGTTIIMATHNKELVNHHRHRVLALEEGQVVRDQEEGVYGYDD